MENECARTQENIATDAELSTEGRIHIRSCPKCAALLLEYQSLAQLVTNSLHAEVPLGFADAVMLKIEKLEVSPYNDWMEKAAGYFERLMSVPLAQNIALALGGGVSLVNLLSFVFFVLIPS